jgi:hypothetical protein
LKNNSSICVASKVTGQGASEVSKLCGVVIHPKKKYV